MVRLPADGIVAVPVALADLPVVVVDEVLDLVGLSWLFGNERGATVSRLAHSDRSACSRQVPPASIN